MTDNTAQAVKTAAANVEAAAKADASQARAEARSWMADHPFLWGIVCVGIGALLGIVATLDAAL